MDFNKLKEINSKLEKIDIKGKDYVQVNQRILGFRELFPEGTIETHIISLENGTVTIKAIIKDGDKVLATGHAQEKQDGTFINKVSYIENCETSAVGRALGILGIGSDTSVRSFEEMENKEFQVTAESTINKAKQDALKMSIKNNNIPEETVNKILNKFNYKDISEILLKDYPDMISEFMKVIK